MKLYEQQNGPDEDEIQILDREYRKDLLKSVYAKIKLKNELLLMRKTYIKYLIQKFRQKVSYIAFTKKMTIVELFCTAIKKTYTQLLKEGII